MLQSSPEVGSSAKSSEGLLSNSVASDNRLAGTIFNH